MVPVGRLYALALVLLGAACLVAGVAMLAPWAGLVITGAGLAALGLLMDDGTGATVGGETEAPVPSLGRWGVRRVGNTLIPPQRPGGGLL